MKDNNRLNEQDLDDYGKIFIIKEKFEKIMDISVGEKDKIGNPDSQILKHRSDEEYDIITETLQRPLNEVSQLSDEEAYEALIANGYIIVKNYKVPVLGTYNDVFLPEDLGLESAKKLFDFENELIESNDNVDIRLHNRVKNEDGREFEFVDMASENFKQTPKRYMSDILKLFIREKIGITNEYENTILKQYREFDLKRILTKEGTKKSVLNRRYAGVILITPNRTICSNCKKETHGNQIISILREYFYDIYEKNRKTSIIDGPEVFQTIMMQFSDDPYFPIAVWNPEKINEYQYKQLCDTVKIIIKIEKDTGRRIPFSYTEKAEKKIEKENINSEDYLKYLNIEHYKMVDPFINVQESRRKPFKKIENRMLFDNSKDSFRTNDVNKNENNFLKNDNQNRDNLERA